jgi:hypothetical protein
VDALHPSSQAWLWPKNLLNGIATQKHRRQSAKDKQVCRDGKLILTNLWADLDCSLGYPPIHELQLEAPWPSMECLWPNLLPVCLCAVREIAEQQIDRVIRAADPLKLISR